METVKKVKDIFRDFTKGGKILETSIEAINLFKKSNKLELTLVADEMIQISEIYALEEYLKTRFLIGKVIIKMVYTMEIDIACEIRENWLNIICYLSKRFPLTKEILKKSQLQIAESQIIVSLPVKGKDILYARGFDRELADLIEDLYGKKYHIIYEENFSNEQKEQTQRMLEEEQKKAIQTMQSEVLASLAQLKTRRSKTRSKAKAITSN